MRILVTGGAGFLGSHVVDWLLRAGHGVTVLDNLSAPAARRRPGTPFLQADVCNPLDGLLAAARPEAVVHLAAQVSVPAAVADPRNDLAVNGLGTVNLLAAAARAGARKLIFVSSAAVYGVPEALPLTEDSPTRPVSPYGLSKLTAENYVRLLGDQYGLAWTILRPANLYGPLQVSGGDGAVVPAFLQRFLAGQDPVIHGDGTQTRDFVHVADMAAAIAAALARADGLTLNVGSGIATSVLSLWQHLAGLLGWRRPPVFGAPRPGDIPHSVLASAAARQHLGWAPRVPLAAGLAETLAWARAAAEAAPAREL